MRNIKLISKALAGAIRASGGNRITADAAKAAMREIMQGVGDGDLADHLSPLMNLSALNQELERSGLVACDRKLSALMQGVKAELEGK